jgi:protein-S-isoprenylcysteine O-methyltransferase Ste14
MNPIGLIALAVAAILIPIILLIVLGHFASKAIARRSPNSQFNRKVSSLQFLHAAIVVAVLMSVTWIGQLHPEGALGRYFALPQGIIVAIVLVLFVSIAFSFCIALGRRLRQKQRGGV